MLGITLIVPFGMCLGTVYLTGFRVANYWRINQYFKLCLETEVAAKRVIRFWSLIQCGVLGQLQTFRTKLFIAPFNRDQKCDYIQVIVIENSLRNIELTLS